MSDRRRYRILPSPLGQLLLTSDGRALTGLHMMDAPGGTHPLPGWTLEDDPCLDEAAGQLSQYFAGKRTAFDLPLAPGGTPFQERVWRALQEIPYGETASYADVARAIGRPRAVRAVGGANGRNPIAIVIPCHRVVASGGGLGGYGGGLARKRILLELEGRSSWWGPEEASGAR